MPGADPEACWIWFILREWDRSGKPDRNVRRNRDDVRCHHHSSRTDIGNGEYSHHGLLRIIKRGKTHYHSRYVQRRSSVYDIHTNICVNYWCVLYGQL